MDENKDYYVVMLWGDIQPELHGPYKTAELRDQKTRDLRNDWGCQHGFYRLEVPKGASVEIDCYSDDEF